jgi:hypothetical protein
MKILSQRQTDKLFEALACDVYDKFIESAIVAYCKLFPTISSKDFDDAIYDKIRERLMVELQILYTEARGEKNAKSRFKKETLKRTVSK